MHKAPHTARIAAATLGLATLLSGCSGSRAALEANPAPCPNVLVLSDASRLIEFEGEERLEDIAWTGEISNVSIACRYFEDKPITGSLEIDFDLGRGPKGDKNAREYTYFVAVTRRNLEVIAKKEFTVRANFSGQNTTDQIREKIKSFVIPRAGEKTSGTNFEIIIGFSLTREQTIYNRSGKSLKFPNLHNNSR